MKNGTALILVLVIMIIMGLGTTAILQAMISYANMKLVTLERIKAQYLAEAGMQYAVWQYRNGNFSSPPTPPFPAGDVPQGWNLVITKTPQDGSYEITVTVQYPGL